MSVLVDFVKFLLSFCNQDTTSFKNTIFFFFYFIGTLSPFSNKPLFEGVLPLPHHTHNVFAFVRTKIKKALEPLMVALCHLCYEGDFRVLVDFACQGFGMRTKW